MGSSHDASEINSWVKIILSKENLKDLSSNIKGNSEKGDNYMGDVFFVHVTGKTQNNDQVDYNLVIKCGQRSQVLRENVPVKETYEQEVYLYETVFPTFNQFQLSKGITPIFDSVPKCYGSYIHENIEVIGLENLKLIGYELHDRKKPLPLDHIKAIVTEYGKCHAVSAALQDQEPKRFKELVDGMWDMWEAFEKTMDLNKFYAGPVDQMYNLIKNDIDKNTAERMILFKDNIEYMVKELASDRNHFSVITHGDCWNNNYMFKYEKSNPTKLEKIVILDWQMSLFHSPVTDLGYFLYACTSGDDLMKNFDDILQTYYNSFSTTLRKLGSNPDKIFSYSQLLADFKFFGKLGLLNALVVIKIALSDKDEAINISETLESGVDMSDTFMYEMKDPSKMKSRVIGVVRHAVEMGYI